MKEVFTSLRLYMAVTILLSQIYSLFFTYGCPNFGRPYFFLKKNPYQIDKDFKGNYSAFLSESVSSSMLLFTFPLPE
jgi:hypothetical protein